MREYKNIVFNNFNQDIGQVENTLTFSSDFESGNLEIAIKKKYLEYDLYMRPDSNTSSHFQWFYFKVKISKAVKTINFRIKNFVKGMMLYNDGLRPFYKSKKKGDQYKQLESSNNVSYF